MKVKTKSLFKPIQNTGTLPGQDLMNGSAIKDIWKKILSYLRYYEMLLSRFWSKAFRDLNLQPMTNVLREIVRALSYDIDPRLLAIEKLSIKEEEESSLDDKKAFIHLLEALRVQYLLLRTETNQKNIESYYVSLNEILISTGISRRNFHLPGVNSLVISMIIDAMYFESITRLRNYKTHPLITNIIAYLDSIKTRNDLTKQQRKRILMVDSIQILKNSTGRMDLDRLKKKFTIDRALSDSEEKVMQENIQDVEFYFNLDGSDTPLSSSVTSTERKFFSPPADRGFDFFVHLNEEMINELKFWNIDLSPYYATPDNAPPLTASAMTRPQTRINAKTHPVIAEALQRSFSAQSFGNQFFAYYISAPMQQFLARKKVVPQNDTADSLIPKRVGFAPLWLRRRLFVNPTDLQEEQIYSLDQFPLDTLPSVFFERDFSQQKLRNSELYCELHFHFSSNGLDEGNIDKIIKTKHSKKTIYLLASRRNITEHYQDLLVALESVKPLQFEHFFESVLWKEIDHLGIHNLYFISWCANNEGLLGRVLESSADFFHQTVQDLLKPQALRWIEDPNYPKSHHQNIRFYKETLCSCFDIIRMASRNVDRKLPPNMICEAIFNPENSLLRPIFQRDLVSIFSPFYSDKMKKNASDNNVAKVFINYYSDGNDQPKPLTVEKLITKVKRELTSKASAHRYEQEKIRKDLYKGKSHLDWLLSPTHEMLLRRFADYGQDVTISRNNPYGWCLALNLQQRKLFFGGMISVRKAQFFLEQFAKQEILDAPEACIHYMDQHLEETHKNESVPFVDVLSEEFKGQLNQLLTLEFGNVVCSADIFIRTYEKLFEALFTHSNWRFSTENFLAVIKLFLSENAYSNSEYFIFILDEFGISTLLDFGAKRIEAHGSQDSTLLHILLSAISLQSLKDTVAHIRYHCLLKLNRESQYIIENSDLITASLHSQPLPSEESSMESKQKKLKLSYDGSYNDRGFFDAFPPPPPPIDPSDTHLYFETMDLQLEEDGLGDMSWNR